MRTYVKACICRYLCALFSLNTVLVSFNMGNSLIKYAWYPFWDRTRFTLLLTNHSTDQQSTNVYLNSFHSPPPLLTICHFSLHQQIRLFMAQFVTHTYTLTHKYIYIYIVWYTALACWLELSCPLFFFFSTLLCSPTHRSYLFFTRLSCSFVSDDYYPSTSIFNLLFLFHFDMIRIKVIYV